MTTARVVLDLRGLKCPLPALRTRKALRTLAAGAELVVLCTDPLAGIDIPHVVRGEGDLVRDQSRDGDLSTFWIMRRPNLADDPEGLDVNSAARK